MKARLSLSQRVLLFFFAIQFVRVKINQLIKQITFLLITPFINIKRKISYLHATKLTGSAIWLLEKVYGKESLNHKLLELREMMPGTVGKEISNLLDSKQYRLIPKFEAHDLKHLVLGYEMTRKGEIRMQAYLLGNGNYTIPCIAFLMIGILYPYLWKVFQGDFKSGKKNKSIYHLNLDDCLNRNLAEIRAEYRSAS